MFFSRFGWIARRSGGIGIGRLTGTGRSGKGLPLQSDRGLVRSFAGTAAGILAVGWGLWLIPSSTDSPLSFDDGGISTGFNSFCVGFLESWHHNKPKFILSESFRKRVFFNYEKRLRLQSRPEKIFEYFASCRTPEGEVLMSAADLMRAVVPVFPPSESDIIREGNLRGEHLPGELHCPPSPLFMLFDTNSDGLISFPEYIFLVTLLAIPESNFNVAFKMFDLDNNGFKDLLEDMTTARNRETGCTERP